MKRFLLGAIVIASLTACASPPKTNIGLVDTARITNNWPKFINYNNQMNSDAAAIERSNAPTSQKLKLRAQLQSRFVSAETELANDVRSAAEQVAKDKGLTYVMTRQYVGYGGTDITTDVEKALKIEEKASPSP